LKIILINSGSDPDAKELWGMIGVATLIPTSIRLIRVATLMHKISRKCSRARWSQKVFKVGHLRPLYAVVPEADQNQIFGDRLKSGA